MKMTDNDPALANEKAAALNGVFLQMFNHGLTAATLFMFIGFPIAFTLGMGVFYGRYFARHIKEDTERAERERLAGMH